MGDLNYRLDLNLPARRRVANHRHSARASVLCASAAARSFTSAAAASSSLPSPTLAVAAVADGVGGEAELSNGERSLGAKRGVAASALAVTRCSVFGCECIRIQCTHQICMTHAMRNKICA